MPNSSCRHPPVAGIDLQIYSSCREIRILPNRQSSACTSPPPPINRSSFNCSGSAVHSPLTFSGELGHFFFPNPTTVVMKRGCIASTCKRGRVASSSYPASRLWGFALSPYRHEPKIREPYRWLIVEDCSRR
ncbi:hypothetical protein SLEP1_g56825 [Rubroshorea leprosula]|uniref:Uncharacterized protein n=1 Tax=Rubroshorea leprosula TaxID=152421 RepID=A0AAV5MMW4_9ROSI|nr:hypothetical protein SLEP1_g56825 [Rubroshorea leprosula]